MLKVAREPKMFCAPLGKPELDLLRVGDLTEIANPQHGGQEAAAGYDCLIYGPRARQRAGPHGQVVSKTQPPPAKLEPLASRATGRVQPQADGSLRRQWPGTYFETAFTGTEAFFRVGSGDVSFGSQWMPADRSRCRSSRRGCTASPG